MKTTLDKVDQCYTINSNAGKVDQLNGMNPIGEQMELDKAQVVWNIDQLMIQLDDLIEHLTNCTEYDNPIEKLNALAVKAKLWFLEYLLNTLPEIPKHIKTRLGFYQASAKVFEKRFKLSLTS